MCIVIDINTFPPVFNERCDRHDDFSPVKEWIGKGQGFLVFGGTRYKDELSKSYRYLRLVRQMKEAGQAIPIRDDLVDIAEKKIIGLTKATDCDDQHIIALLGTSKCPLFCSCDSRSYKHIQDKTLYPNRMSRVRIYTSRRNKKELLKPMNYKKLKNRV